MVGSVGVRNIDLQGARHGRPVRPSICQLNYRIADSDRGMPNGAVRPRIDSDLLRIKNFLHESNQFGGAVYMEVRNHALVAIGLVRDFVRHHLFSLLLGHARPCGAASLPE